MNKRDMVLSLVESPQTMPYIPAAFFLHFPSEFHAGQAAVDKHLEFFRYTGMDFVKIQYEATFPVIPTLQTPNDWANLPHYGKDFFEGQLKAVEGLVNAAKREAVIVVTLYSPFMCAGHTTSGTILTDHLNQEPEKVRKGLEIITDSLLGFVRECIKLGVDGFYMSTQGSEARRFIDPRRFEECVKPYDLVLMNEAAQRCSFNILHVCDYVSDYDDFQKVLDYPGNIVNAPLTLSGKNIVPQDVANLFKRPFMGGLERKGVLAHGTPDQIRQTVQSVLHETPSILSADCTVPNETSWDNLKIAIETAHTNHPQ